MLNRDNLHLKALVLCLASLVFSAPTYASFVGDVTVNLSQTEGFAFDLTNAPVGISTPGTVLAAFDGSVIGSSFTILQGTSIEFGVDTITFNVFGGGAPLSDPLFRSPGYSDAEFVLSGFSDTLVGLFDLEPGERLGIQSDNNISNFGNSVIFDYALDTITFKLGDLGISTVDGTNIGSITIGYVPLPAALPLMLSALGLLGFMTRRRKA